MDVRLPGIDGISAVKRIAEDAPNVKTVIFSAYGDKRLLSDAIAAGARGYVMKGSPPEDLIRAVRTVASRPPVRGPLALAGADHDRPGRPTLRCQSASARSFSCWRAGCTPRRWRPGSGSAPRR